MTIDDARERVGSKVVYRAPHVARTDPGEEGVITAVSSAYVFVRFGADVGSKATPPEMLEVVAT